MKKCENCGAPTTGRQCDYCGSTNAPAEPERRTIRSDMTTYRELRDTVLLGDMNTIKRAINCIVRGDMNTVRADDATIVEGDMNTVRPLKS